MNYKSDNSGKRDELANSFLFQSNFTRCFLYNFPQLRDCTTRILDTLHMSVHIMNKDELHHIIDYWKEREKVLIKKQNNVTQEQTKQRCNAIDWFAEALKLQINYTLQSNT